LRGISTNDQFFVEDIISAAIINNQPMPVIQKPSCATIIEVLEKIYQLGKARNEENRSTEELFYETKRIIDTHNHFSLIKKVKQMEMDDSDTYLFLYLCWKTIIGDESTDLKRVAEGILDNSVSRVFYTQRFFAKENALQKKGWVEIEEAAFLNDSEIKLTDQSKDLLKSENIKLFTRTTRKDNIISPDKIGHTQLFYNPKEKHQFFMLENMLEENNLKKLQKRLHKKATPGGITVLLYGAPGTGKTESVFQIAKQTGREIMRVEISQSKSMWFGQSEKIIKRIFTDYKQFYKESDRCPILLFNEADAIISKRKENFNSNVGQTENAIQNILLEELENFRGILFATTNLANNLDKAFDRRFLFKVEFFKPDAPIRAEIWKSKLASLKMDKCKLLAEKFDFSGGQIDNIARKYEMSEILSGRSPEINEIIGYCEEEIISQNGCTRIGFSLK